MRWAPTFVVLPLLLALLPVQPAEADSPGWLPTQKFVCLPKGEPEVSAPLLGSGCAKLVVSTREPAECMTVADVWGCIVVAKIELTVFYGPGVCGWATSEAVEGRTLDACTDAENLTKTIELPYLIETWHTDIPAKGGRDEAFRSEICVRPVGTSHTTEDDLIEDCVEWDHVVHLRGEHGSNGSLEDLVLDEMNHVASLVTNVENQIF